MLAPYSAMLVEGACENGHAVVCALYGGRVTGALARGALRHTCPSCGAEVYVHLESAILPVQRASQPDIGAPDAVAGAKAQGSDV
jgi:hypothetical protein